MIESRDSHLAGNIARFSRALRAAGLPVGSAQIVDALRAAVSVGLAGKDDFRTALRSSLLTDVTQYSRFERAFEVFFRRPELLLEFANARQPAHEDRDARAELQQLFATTTASMALDDGSAGESHDAGRLAFSAVERLRNKDFENMTFEERQDAIKLLSAGIEPLRKRPSRRYRHWSSGDRIDLRRSVQLMARADGQPLQLARKSRRKKAPALVLLCDISASMRQYSRLFLHFAHVMSTREANVHSFVFGTRLSNISRLLRGRDVDAALTHVSRGVMDWEGGTRIASSLRQFNAEWGRRTLARNSVVVLLSDGLERDTHSDLGLQMQRLHRSCRHLVWLNPLLRFSGFAAKATGIRTMLPHVDHFVPAHNVDSLLSLARLLNGETDIPGFERRSGLAA